MSQELDEILMMMHAVCLQEAVNEVTPEKPPTAAIEQQTDAFCLDFAKTGEARLPHPEVAAALIPRLLFARPMASVAEAAFRQQESIGDAAATDEKILELLLVSMWHQKGKALWLERDPI